MAAANCEGCSNALCTKHFIEHRRFLGEEMNVIISEHDQFQHTLNQQTKSPNSHPLITQIDEWEKNSIHKIQQKAKELRQELLQLATVHLEELSTKFRHLSTKLKEGREEDSFVETDLRGWKKSLDHLKENLNSPSTFSVRWHDNNPLIQNISLNLIRKSDTFDQVFDNKVRIEDNGQLVIHDEPTGYTEIRGKNEYTSGRHEIRLCIEQSAGTWTFLGINSKLTPLQYPSYSSISACGWTNNNYIWLNGGCKANTSTRIEIATNDIITLIFDCDNHKISMVNQRINAKHELDVEINNCQFPWQLHVILYEPNSRIRILSASSEHIE